MFDTGRDVLSHLKAACAYIMGPDATGTGYLVAPQRLATALHVVQSWQQGAHYPVVVGIDGPQCQARLLRSDAATDAAILAFDDHIAATPLPLANTLERQADWEAYGFPTTAAHGAFPTGLLIGGHVQDPKTRDDAGHSALLLYSDMIAAGNASPLHGFSGSPVLVDGAVVGHLTKHLGDPDDRRRAAYGFVYACPIHAVYDLLDVKPTSAAIDPPALASLSDVIPRIPPAEYHVFISYRSTDRDWAMSLVARLEGAGLRVFIDQRALVAGDYLAEQLQSALQRSHAAVVLVSQGWLESRWCQTEANVLLKRAVEDQHFKLIPLRLDDSDMPPLLDARLWLDFKGKPCAEGDNVGQLLYALIGLTPPSRFSAAGRMETAVARVVDDVIDEIEVAGRSDPHRVLQALHRWQSVGSTDVAPVIAAAEVLLGQNRPDLTLTTLAGTPETLRVQQLRAFAFRRNGDIDHAVELLEQLYRRDELDPETAGLLAGSYKARWLRTGNRAFLQLSYKVYRETYERSGDPFNGINTAAMALHSGDRLVSYQVAFQVRDTLLRRPRVALDHWGLATLGEACLLLERFDDARDWYREACGAAAGLPQDIAVMRRQARLNLEALKQPRDRFDDLLPVPKVLAYMGHMVDEDGRSTPRFPREKVGRVRQTIQQRLGGHGPLHGFGTAARGSDILFLETLLERDYGATVVLPFPAEEFLAVSGGGRWNERFRKIQANPRTEFRRLKDSRPPDTDLPNAFDEANREVQRGAVEYARRLDERPIVIAVWDGKRGDGPGGTADAVALWKEDGYDVEVIDIAAV